MTIPPALLMAQGELVADEHAVAIVGSRKASAAGLDFARSVVPAQVQVEVFAIDRQGEIVGHAGAFA